MRRLLYLATLSMLVMLVLAPTALAQTVETVPLNPDGACPEGFVTVNAAYKQPEKNSEQGRGERKDYKTRQRQEVLQRHLPPALPAGTHARQNQTWLI